MTGTTKKTTPRVQPMRRRAVLTRCPRCRRPTLSGYDDFGLLTHSDPTPITRTAELQLFLVGHQTHALERGELVRRDAWRVRRPSTYGPVVVEHRCDQVLVVDQLAPVPPLPGHLLPDGDTEPPF